MCPDYRQLNKITIKDRFSIPIIDELLNELHGEIFFTKLDIPSEYNQIRMRQYKIPKITFRTNEGHCHFWVILCSYKCAFNILKPNEVVFQTLLKFMLVFFDGIIIYNKTWEDHVQHVDRVLTLLQEK